MSEQILKLVEPLAQEVCDREGYELYDIEYIQGKQILRVYIDKTPEGVSLDDCANFSSGLNLLLDVEDPIPNHYTLEVSSPGLDRHLSRPWHFKKQLGKEIKIVLKARTETSKSLGVKNVTGKLKSIEDLSIKIEKEEGLLCEVPLEDIHKSNVVF